MDINDPRIKETIQQVMPKSHYQFIHYEQHGYHIGIYYKKKLVGEIWEHGIIQSYPIPPIIHEALSKTDLMIYGPIPSSDDPVLKEILKEI